MHSLHSFFKRLSVLMFVLFFFSFPAYGAQITESHHLLPPNTHQNDWVGNSVDISGRFAIVGSYGFPVYDDQGAFLIYEWSNGTWVYRGRYQSNDINDTDYFGYCVAISGDTAVISAYSDEDQFYLSGAAYVFERSGNSWFQRAKLTPSDAKYKLRFGHSVDISGETIAIGTAHDDDNSGLDMQAVYIFQKPANGWSNMTETQKISLSAGTFSDVSIGGGNLAAKSGTTVYTYHDVSGTGQSWSSKGTFSVSAGAYTQDDSIDISDSGNTLIVAQDTSAKIYTYNGSWTHKATLTAPAQYVAIQDFGAVLADNNSLTAHVFKKPDSGWVSTTTSDDTLVPLHNATTRSIRSVAIANGAALYGTTGIQPSSDNGGVYCFNIGDQAPPPVLTSPAADSVQSATSIPFSWEPVPGTLGYQLDIATTQDMSIKVYSQNVGTLTQIQINNFPNDGTPYYWKVASQSIYNSNSSEVRRFENGVAIAPILIAPVHGAVAAGSSVSFSWNPFENSTHYVLQISQVPDFSTHVYLNYVYDTNVTISGFPDDGSVFYWRVVGMVNSTMGPYWSTGWGFYNGQ